MRINWNGVLDLRVRRFCARSTRRWSSAAWSSTPTSRETSWAASSATWTKATRRCATCAIGSFSATTWTVSSTSLTSSSSSSTRRSRERNWCCDCAAEKPKTHLNKMEKIEKFISFSADRVNLMRSQRIFTLTWCGSTPKKSQLEASLQSKRSAIILYFFLSRVNSTRSCYISFLSGFRPRPVIERVIYWECTVCTWGLLRQICVCASNLFQCKYCV